ncbi:MAG TPA: GNAT family N-acetyltransferase, partial [Actinopolymorphaceae bacterium]
RSVEASGHSEAYIGVLDDEPMSYWELYRADLDPVARHYDAHPHDGGIHLLLGPESARGRGLGAKLIRAAADHLLNSDPRTTRVIAEPDVRNHRSIRAFERAGFVRSGDLDLPDKRAALMVLPRTFDLVGVGIGPFNLALAALADGVSGLSTRFYEQKPQWSWHPGLLFDDARLQVPFLADLVTLVDPTSPWSFLSYLREHGRLFPFYFSERFHVPRREYDHYCAWVSGRLPSCRFDSSVTDIRWDGDAFVVTSTQETVRARNVVLGVGTELYVPEQFRRHLGTQAFSAADYLDCKEKLTAARDITVIGSGQTGAEVFLDLLRSQPDHGARIRWLTRSPAFAPMEYSKLGLEHFTPDYARYFHALPEATRDRLLPSQWQLYKAISAETIAQIYDLLYERGVGGGRPDVELMPDVAVEDARGDSETLELHCRHRTQERDFVVSTEAVVLATGLRPRRPRCLDGLAGLIRLDEQGRFRVGSDYRVRLAPEVDGHLYVQNAELHTHGVGAPDLGLGAHRAAVIINDVLGHTAYPLPARTSFTTFGLENRSVPTHAG